MNVPPVIPPSATAPPSTPRLVPLEKIPYPPYVLVLAAVTAIAFVIGLVRLPGSIKSGIDLEMASHYLEINQPKRAAELLKPLVMRYPEAKDARVDLAKAYILSGQLKEGVMELNYFEGQQVDEDFGHKLDEVAGLLDEKIKALPEEKGATN